jgi:hypothetical protein
MTIWVLLKCFLEMNYNIMDLLTKDHPNPVCHLGEKLKSSPTGKFVAHVVKGVANSNSLINLSCRNDDTLYKSCFVEERIGFMIQERRELEEHFSFSFVSMRACL